MPVTAGKVAGNAIGAGIVATGVIKNKKSGSDMEKENGQKIQLMKGTDLFSASYGTERRDRDPLKNC